jgi:pyruvyltransferase
MKKPIKLFYAQVPNMGDLLNPLIVEKVFGKDVKKTPLYGSQLIAIGSGLNALFKSESLKTRLNQAVLSKFSNELHVWGTGFIRKPTQKDFFRNNIIFNSVRGELSKIELEKILNTKLDITTGDAGLLANSLFNRKIPKKYKLGIIPHFRHQDAHIFSDIKQNNNNSVIIDLKEDPMKVIEMIGQCEFIISSSLHGLIVADSFNIPNIHLDISINIKGDGFKFADYYSSFGLNHNPISSNEIANLNKDICNIIEDNYSLDNKVIDKKRNDIINAFPFK